MIKPLQSSSLNFKANTQETATNAASVMSPILKERLNATSNADYIKMQVQAAPKKPQSADKNETTTEDTEKKPKVSLFNRFLNFTKNANKGLKTASGAAKGVMYAIPATLISGAVMKNILNNSEDGALSVKGLFGAIGGTISDAAGGILNAGKFLWRQKDEKVGQAILNIVTSPSKFYKNYMKGHKWLAAGASAIGLGVIAFNVFKSRITANRQNSNIDHNFYTEHKI